MKVWFPAIQASSGADVFVQRLSQALVKQGIGVEVTWFDKYFEFAPFLLSTTKVPPGIDIIHSSSWCGFAFKRRAIPLVVTEFHCVYDESYRPFKSFLQDIYHQNLARRLEQASFRKADATTAISAFTAASLVRSANMKDVRLIYLWVETEKFKPVNTAPRPEGHPFRLLYVGNLSRRKGADLLEPIMRSLGDGFQLRFTTGLRDIAKDQYPNNMIPMGRLSEEELIHEYQICDALLFPSRFEGFGYAPLEAMACGKPVVATHATSIPEVVESGVSGLLCPTDDISAFAAACRKLSADRDLCGKMGEAGRKRAVEVFSEEVIVSHYIALYQSLLKV